MPLSVHTFIDKSCQSKNCPDDPGTVWHITLLLYLTRIHGYYGITVKPCRVYMFVHLLNVIHGATGRPINPTDGGAKPHPGTAVSQTHLTFLFFFHFQFLEMSGMTKLFLDCSVCIMVEMVGECQTQKPVNFMTRSQLDKLHHGQALSSQKGSCWEGVQVYQRDVL